jgi:hypothetical protein
LQNRWIPGELPRVRIPFSATYCNNQRNIKILTTQADDTHKLTLGNLLDVGRSQWKILDDQFASTLGRPRVFVSFGCTLRACDLRPHGT